MSRTKQSKSGGNMSKKIKTEHLESEPQRNLETEAEPFDPNLVKDESEDVGNAEISIRFVLNSRFSLPPSYEEFRKNLQYTDVTFTSIEKLPINAHRTIIAGVSNRMKELINGLLTLEMSTGELKTIDTQYRMETLESIFKIIYTGHCDIRVQNVPEFEQAAEYFELDVSKQKQGKIDVSNMDFSKKTAEEMIQTFGSQGAGGHVCLICPKTFTTKSHLKTHFLDMHINVGKKYSCRTCNKVMSTENAGRIHISKYHKDMKGVPFGDIITVLDEE